MLSLAEGGGEPSRRLSLRACIPLAPAVGTSLACYPWLLCDGALPVCGIAPSA